MATTANVFDVLSTVNEHDIPWSVALDDEGNKMENLEIDLPEKLTRVLITDSTMYPGNLSMCFMFIDSTGASKCKYVNLDKKSPLEVGDEVDPQSIRARVVTRNGQNVTYLSGSLKL